MATPSSTTKNQPQKRKTDEQESTTGFIVDLSPIKRSRKNNDYFRAVCQTGANKYTDIVSFRPSSYAYFKDAQAKKSPMKFENTAIIPNLANSSVNDIKFHQHSSLKPLKKQLTFKYNKPQSTLSAPDIETLHLKEVEEKAPHQKVSITAKLVKFLSDTTQKEVYNNAVSCREALLADETGFMKVVLWGNIIETVTVDNVYKFSELGVRTTNRTQTRHLTTTPNTIVTRLDIDLIIEDTEPQEEIEKITDATINQLNINLRKAWQNCKATVPPAIDLSAFSFKCANCNMRQRVSSVLTLVRANIDVTKDGKLYKLTAFDDTVISHLENHGFVMQADTSADDIETYLLSLDTFSELTFSSENVILTIL
ncbi:uncharacterized protein LOC135496017 [Lineus longissimus]|uniref:uncharacterized protein LOC135496017 n=1 Tax=Lineus longissimus TaxID=88925 RepID=UPI00315C6718